MPNQESNIELKGIPKKVTYKIGFNLETSPPWYAMEKESGFYLLREFEAETKDKLIESMREKGINISIDFDIGDEGIKERRQYSEEITVEKYILKLAEKEKPEE